MDVIWLLSAMDTLNEHVAYVADDDPAAAQRLRARIIQQVASLATMPNRGRPGRVVGTRELVVTRTPYIVAYRVRAGTVEVLRVVHGAQRWPQSFEA
jgi:toxin ParE1/3/4